MEIVANESFSDDTNGGRPATSSVIAAVFASALALVVISGNLLVIAAFAKNANLRNIANTFLVSLACADLLVGVVVIPFYTILSFVNEGSWYLGRWSCLVFYAVDVMASTASILHLCVVSADRYVAIVYPMKYPAKMTRRLSNVLMLAAWVLALCISFPWIYFWHVTVMDSHGQSNECPLPESAFYNILSSAVCFIIPAIIIIIFYGKILLVARKHTRRVQKGRLQPANSDAKESMRIHRGGACHQTISNREYKAAKTVGLVIGAFLVCWLPVFIVIIIHSWCGHACDQVRPLIYWLGFLNSAMNPFIYAFTNSQFKEAFVRILCFLTIKRNRGGPAENGSNSRCKYTPRQISQHAASEAVSASTELHHIYF